MKYTVMLILKFQYSGKYKDIEFSKFEVWVPRNTLICHIQTWPNCANSS